LYRQQRPADGQIRYGDVPRYPSPGMGQPPAQNTTPQQQPDWGSMPPWIRNILQPRAGDPAANGYTGQPQNGPGQIQTGQQNPNSLAWARFGGGFGR